MTPALFMGLVVTAAGLLMVAISGLLIRGAVSGHLWLRPGPETDVYRRRKSRQVRTIATSWTVLGVGITLFGLITGR